MLKNNPRMKITAVTFTREGANEIRNRIQAFCGSEVRRVSTGTFHSLAFQQLGDAGVRQRVLSPADQTQMMRRAWIESGQEIKKWDQALQAIGYYKSQIDPSIPDRPDGRLYRTYQNLLNEHGAWDFSDLLLQAVNRMRDGKLGPFNTDALLIDEFQDSDPAQYAWLRAHRHLPTIFAVGDDDQSIFGWRGGMGYEGFRRFEADFSAQRILLSRNYRSRGEILTSATRVIAKNHYRAAKRLTPMRGHGGMIRLHSFRTRDEEVAAIATAVKETPGNWAVLGRTNSLLDHVEGALSAMEIPHRRIGGRRLWDSRHVGALLSALRAVATGDNFSFGQFLSWLHLDESELRALQKNSASLKRTILAGVWPEIVRRDKRKLLTELSNHLKSWSAQISKNSLNQAIEGVSYWMYEHSGSIETIRIAGAAVASMKGSLAQRLNTIQQLGTVRQTENHGLATVITMHSAKGLEFHSVWGVGIEQGVCPHTDSDAAEERRLFYVCMTRAMERLEMSSCMEAPVSQFLNEAGLAVRS